MQKIGGTSRRFPALLLAAALLVVTAASARGAERAPIAEVPDARRAPDARSDTLPDSLPPLDGDLLGLLEEEPEPTPAPRATLPRGVTVFGDGRLRLEVDQRSLIEPAATLHEGASLTGRVGLEGAVGPTRARIVLGGGERFGRKPPLPPFPLVEQAPLDLLREAALTFDVGALGLPLRLTLGRFPVEVADGRLIGVEDFAPLGRTFDGALVDLSADDLVLRGGGLYLGPYTAELDDTRWAAFVESGYRASLWGASFWRGTAYAIVHRDTAGLTPVTSATLGARTTLESFGLSLSLGADGQLPFLDDAPLDPAGFGAHLEGALRYAPAIPFLARKGMPFVELSGEWTGGTPVKREDGAAALVEPRFRLPAPSLHPFLGLLDLARADNVTSVAAAVGFFTDDGLLLEVEGRLIALSDPKGILTDARGTPLPHYPSSVAREVLGSNDRAVDGLSAINDEALAFTEIDARLRLPLFEGVELEGEYGVALPGPAFGDDARGAIQRLLVSLRFTIDAAASP